MPGMWSASSRTDERGVGLRDVHYFRDLANLLASQQRLNSPNVTLLRKPVRQTFRIPPRVRHGVVTDTFRNPILGSLSLRSRMTDQRNLRHVLSGKLDSYPQEIGRRGR